mgnify:CR=1 FL=1
MDRCEYNLLNRHATPVRHIEPRNEQLGEERFRRDDRYRLERGDRYNDRRRDDYDRDHGDRRSDHYNLDRYDRDYSQTMTEEETTDGTRKSVGKHPESTTGNAPPEQRKTKDNNWMTSGIQLRNTEKMGVK